MNWQEAQHQLQSGLQGLYEVREAATMADWVMENISGWKKIDRILHKNEALPTPAQELLKKYTAELLTHKPVQYVLKESWFAGMKFYVDEQVLIPRPETEELVDWICSEAETKLQAASDRPGHSSDGSQAIGDRPGHTGDRSPATSEPNLSILDVGTGSGCIPIALKKKLDWASVTACDISAEALAIAQRNASTHGAPIHFIQLDFLDSLKRAALPPVHFLVSNPPYIPVKDKSAMAPNVVNFEPHLALFVEDGDPLIFYRALANFAREKLLPGGALFVEIHEDLAAGVMQVFQQEGFPGLTLKKDMQGKDRMIKATW